MKPAMLVKTASVFAIMAIGGIVGAQTGENTKPLDAQESAFLRGAVQDDVFMERLGQYAADHAATDEVRRLGRQMATDHKADREQIQQLAKDHALNLTGHDADLTPSQQAVYDRLTTKPGKDFDKDYTKVAVAEHNKMVGEYERERDHAADVAVREYAGKELGGLHDHLKMSENAEKVAWGE